MPRRQRLRRPRKGASASLNRATRTGRIASPLSAPRARGRTVAGTRNPAGLSAASFTPAPGVSVLARFSPCCCSSTCRLQSSPLSWCLPRGRLRGFSRGCRSGSWPSPSHSPSQASAIFSGDIPENAGSAPRNSSSTGEPKHIKAHRFPGMGYVVPLCFHMLTFGWFRCSSCGTPVRLKK